MRGPSNSEFKQTLLCTRATHNTTTGYTDKLFLPPSTLTALLDSRKSNDLSSRANANYSPFGEEETNYSASNQTDLLPSPLIFRLRPASLQAGLSERQRDSTSVCCGVREFSCEEGQARVPEWLMNELDLAEGDSVSVELVRLQKGTHAQLQALNPMSRSVGDLRSLLEAYMRTKLTALTIGETLLVPISGAAQPLSFRVAALEPADADAVDIVDTDLSVDIVYTNLPPMADQSVADRSSSGGSTELLPGVGVEVDVDGEQVKSFTLHFPTESNSVDVLLDCRSGDASLVASSLVQNASLVDNTWFDFSAPSHKQKRISITRDQLLPQGSDTVHLSIVGYTASCQARVSIEFDRVRKDSIGNGTRSFSGPDEDGMRLCANCGSSVPIARFDMHRVVCERHNIKCAHCDSIFKRGSEEAERHWHCEMCGVSGDIDDRAKHLHFFHTPTNCNCDPELPTFASIVELAEHRRTRCPERLIECRYCHNIEPQGVASSDATDIMDGLNAHEAYCGNRTIECIKCKANVRIRQVLVHMRMHQVREQVARENMLPCANKECSRERAQNPLGLCTSCFGPLYTGQHDPDNHKLLKRLARTLHTQLTRGCGSQHCHNPMCASGLQNSKGSAASSPSQTEAAALMIPVLKAYAPLSTLQRPAIDYTKVDLHLCI
ncbi:hypothetical protein GGI21_003509 [Coemansia aciculifera]|nr:hypothetical protein GGI21_003509 [Coemansia aciculifera]